MVRRRGEGGGGARPHVVGCPYCNVMGRIGNPIGVQLGIRSDPFLGIKLASLYKEGICTS
jgi:hypothetical protein